MFTTTHFRFFSGKIFTGQTANELSLGRMTVESAGCIKAKTPQTIPKSPLHHEKAAAWRYLISQHNENSSVIRPAAIEYVLSWVTVTGLPVSPLTQDQLMEFTAFLESRGRNPFESGTRYRREFRKILVRAGLYVETAVKHDYSLPSEYESLFKEMEAHAVDDEVSRSS